MRGLLSIVLSLLGLLAPAAPASAQSSTPQIRHLFVIVMENKDQDITFGSKPPAPYLAQDMVAQGAYLPNYFGIGHESLDNYIAMVSGQPPNVDTQADCQIFSEMTPGTLNGDGVAVGQGCVYPNGVRTVADQLQGAGYSWKGYMQDMTPNCNHPAIGARDGTQTATAASQYAARHNPFVYFHGIIDSPVCAQNDVNLDQLTTDLKTEKTTPNYSFITPDLCADGHDGSCVDPKQQGGYNGINDFLKEWVPKIEASAAYQDHGAILVTFDESEAGAESCCNEPTGPNTPNNGGPVPGSGGGKVGSVLVSPCTRPGTVVNQDYNHYSMLRWVEDNFGLPHLGYAAPDGLVPFGADVFNRADCNLTTKLKASPRKARAGKRTTFRFRIVSPLAICKQEVAVRFAGKRRRSNGNGVVRIKATVHRPGRKLARAYPADCPRAKVKVRVKPAR